MKYESRNGKPCAKVAILAELNRTAYKQLSAGVLHKLPYSPFTITEAITKLQRDGIVERERIGMLTLIKIK